MKDDSYHVSTILNGGFHKTAFVQMLSIILF